MVPSGYVRIGEPMTVTHLMKNDDNEIRATVLKHDDGYYVVRFPTIDYYWESFTTMAKHYNDCMSLYVVPLTIIEETTPELPANAFA